MSQAGTNGFRTVTVEDIRGDLAPYEEFGVRLMAAEVGDVADRKRIRVMLAFDDIRSLARTAFFADNRVSLYLDQQGDYVLEQRMASASPDEFQVNLSPPGTTSGGDLPEGFRAVFEVAVPGRIVRANADVMLERTARWILAPESQPEAIRFARGAPMRLVFDGEGLDLPAPRRMHVQLPPPP